MSTHTKRSAAFAHELELLIDYMSQDLSVEHSQKLNARVIEVLRNNTTDSACMVKAKDNEPIFVLRGQDRNAYGAVNSWAYETGRQARQEFEVPGIPPKLIKKLADAQLCALEMKAYHKNRLAD
jgi:hypothetical protein